ncbi:MAG: helix-turn-helix domain-containing protein [Verrucomicrobiota bacterium]
MNTTTRAILQTVATSDPSLTGGELDLVHRLISGRLDEPAGFAGACGRILVTQKQAAEILSVNRVTIWRMTKDRLLHPAEILPGTWRYSLHEITRLAQRGVGACECSQREPAAAHSP